jgi:hypothetical protein
LWRHEARDFTTWLADNLDLLSETLGFPLTLVQTEMRAGIYSADILAKSGERTVVIENQLESTDHDHLGKLITYLSNLDAKIAIWITSAPRPEHENAIHWLNEWLPIDVAFYLVKIDAVRIGTSHAAAMFSIVAGPSAAAVEAGEVKKEIAERRVQYREFWAQLLPRAKEKTQLHARISPGTDYWVSTGAGRGGLAYSYVLLNSNARIELYIDRGEANENKQIFDVLYAQKATIEQAFGAPLNWQRLDDRRACRISYAFNSGGVSTQDRWPQIQDEMIDAMVRFELAFRSPIASLPGR